MADEKQINTSSAPESLTEPSHENASGLHDKRVRPEGVVPKQAQGYVVAGLAVLILMAVMFSKNHAKPAANEIASSPLAVSTDVNQRKIQELEQDLSADQRQSQQRAGTAPPTEMATVTNPAQPGVASPAAQLPPPVTATEPPRDPVADAEKALAFKARFASNLVFPDDGAAHPDALQLAVSELEAQTALHKIGADLGEEIAVEQGPNGLVQVNGLVADDSRKQQVDSALAGIPFTQVRVATIAQATAHQQPSHKLTDAAVSNPTTVASVNPPLLEDQLKKRFPDTDQRAEYVNQSLALCQSASARAWALNRLADRYTPEQIALLDHGSQQQLQSLLADHISALREDVSRLQNQLSQVLSATSNTAAANTVIGSDSKAPATGEQSAPDDWRNRVHRVHSSVETTNEAVSTLLAASSQDDSSPDKLQLQLRTTLTELLAELQSLDQQVHKQL